MKKDSRNQAYSQRQLRVGELIKQNLGEILSAFKIKGASSLE